MVLGYHNNLLINEIYNMENFGQFIDDIRKEIKWINISFEEVPFGESMVISVPNSRKTHIIDTTKIGKIEYGTPLYTELLGLTLSILRNYVNPPKL